MTMYLSDLKSYANVLYNMNEEHPEIAHDEFNSYLKSNIKYIGISDYLFAESYNDSLFINRTEEICYDDLRNKAIELYIKYEDAPATAYREFQSYLNSKRENMTLDDYLRAGLYNDYMYMLYRKKSAI